MRQELQIGPLVNEGLVGKLEREVFEREAGEKCTSGKGSVGRELGDRLGLV